MSQQHHTRQNSARLTIGDVVLISDPSEGIGVVRHIDEISFIIGIELTDPLGTSDGVRNKIRYFKCRPRYGIFVSVSDIVRLVSPEELLHKIVVLNRALAHKHSTLTTKNQSIDKLKNEIVSLKQTLSSYMENAQNLKEQIKELRRFKDNHLQKQLLVEPPSDHHHSHHHNRHIVSNGHRLSNKQQPLNEEASIEIDLDDDIMRQISTNTHINNNNNPNRRNLKGSLNRASKPQTPEQLSDDEDDDDGDDDSSSNPRSRPPSRRGSFLREYSHFGSNDINRKLILNRGRKINNALSSYMSKNRLYTNRNRKPKTKKTHSRQFSNEQLGFPGTLSNGDSIASLSTTASPISIASSSKKRKSQKHRRKKSNVEEAADIIRKEQTKRIRQMNQGSDDELSDDSFAKIRDKFNASIGNSDPVPITHKRLSQSQPTSPRRFENEFNFHYADTPKLNTSHSEENGNQNGMKPTSIWRKNRREFLDKMDEKLKNVMSKFDASKSSTTMFSDKPLKRGMHSYHASLGGFNHSNNIPTHKKASNSMNMQWMTHKTTFSQYNKENDAKFKMAAKNSTFDHSANAFSMIPRRSISAPSSPKHLNPLTLQRDSSLIDRLDLGDDDHEHHDDDEDDEEDEEEQQRDVLEDSEHSMEESTVSDDDNYNQRGHLRKKQSTKVIYGNTRSLRRRRLRRGLKSRYNETVSEDHSTDEPQQIEDDELYEDTQESKSKSVRTESEEENENEEEEEEEEEQTYYRRTRRIGNRRKKRYLYKNDSTDSDKEQQEIIDSDEDNNEEEEEEEQQHKNDEFVDLDEEQYKYYQQKKRNSKVHLLDKDEFEKEYNSILQ